MKGIWLARDESGGLFIFTKKPYRHKNSGIFEGSAALYVGGYSKYPDITYENSPVFIPITKDCVKQCLNRSKTH